MLREGTERSLETFTEELETSEQGETDAVDIALESLEEEWSASGVVFQSWWSSTEDSTRIGLLQSARELFANRLSESSPEGANILPVLCPEISDERLARLAAPGLLPALIYARLTDAEKVQAHDEGFVRANCSQQKSSEEQTRAAVTNRTLLMTTFLTDVLVLARHLAAVPDKQ
eukprot:1185304-Prorocentrum_minimum.AAC.5